MSRKLKFSVKNVTSGLKSLSELLTGHATQHHNRFSRLVPRSIPLRKPNNCNYFEQDYVQKSKKFDFTKISTLTPPPGESALKRISSELPLDGKRLDTLNFSSVRSPTHGFPWGSTYRFYYDVPKPQCPPPGPKPCSGDGKGSAQKGSSVCPPLKGTMPSKSNPCGARTTGPKHSPCTRKMSTFTVPLNIYRFYCSGSKKPRRCPPRGGGGAGKGTGKGPVCPSQKKVPDCSGGKKGGGGRKGPVCPSQKKVPDCSGGAKKPSKSRCAPRGKKGGGGARGRCGPPKGKKGGGGGGRSKCTPKRGSRSDGGGSKSRCGSKKSGGSTSQGPRKCTPKKSSQSKGGGRCGSKKSGGGSSGSSAGKCKPNIQRPPSCGSKKKSGRAGSKCERKGPPKKPKC